MTLAIAYLCQRIFLILENFRTEVSIKKTRKKETKNKCMKCMFSSWRTLPLLSSYFGNAPWRKFSRYDNIFFLNSKHYLQSPHCFTRCYAKVIHITYCLLSNIKLYTYLLIQHNCTQHEQKYFMFFKIFYDARNLLSMS